MTNPKSLYHGHRFPAAIISLAVRWYFRFQLSLRDIEELLFERCVIVSHETIRRWCDKFGAVFAGCAKTVRRKTGSTWHLDEMCVTLRGEPYVLWRAVDDSTHVVRFFKPVGDRFGRGMKAIPAIAIPCDRDGELMAAAPCFPPRDREPTALSHAGAREQLHRPVAGPATRRSP